MTINEIPNCKSELVRVLLLSTPSADHTLSQWTVKGVSISAWVGSRGLERNKSVGVGGVWDYERTGGKGGQKNIFMFAYRLAVYTNALFTTDTPTLEPA